MIETVPEKLFKKIDPTNGFLITNESLCKLKCSEWTGDLYIILQMCLQPC